MCSVSLLDVLQNELILRHIGPYLGLSVLSLAATSKRIRFLILENPEVLTYLDLSKVRSLDLTSVRWNRRPQWYDNSNSDLTEEDFYSQPLDHVLSSLGFRFLCQVRTLVLDGLYVSIKILMDLLCNEDYSVRILSVRGIHGLSNSTLLRVLRYAFRPSRLPERPPLKGLYCCIPIKKISTLEKEFRDMTVIGEYEHFSSNSVMARSGASLGAGIQESSASRPQFDPFILSPYHDFGFNEDIFNSFSSDNWANFISSCQSFLSFDVVLCPGNHPPAVATVRLQGCQSCGSCPEKPAYPGKSPEDRLPLLYPPPRHSFSVKAAQRLDVDPSKYPPFIVRCKKCLADRWCERCTAWWCEDCYEIPKMPGSSKDDSSPTTPAVTNIMVHHGLCVSKCLMDDLLNGVGEGGMWG